MGRLLLQTTKERLEKLEAFQRQTNIRFRDVSFLNLAFFHRSSTNSFLEQNERLEFLGDSILGFISAHLLYKLFPNKKEGELSIVKSSIVSEQSLSQIARKLSIDLMLVLGKGEELSEGRNKNAILADAFEALIGASFLDSGIETLQEWLGPILEEQILLYQNSDLLRDFKSLLHELGQKKFKSTPKYTLIDTLGPDHQKTFFMTLKIGDRVFGPESGMSLKETEKKLAQIAYQELKEE